MGAYDAFVQPVRAAVARVARRYRLSRAEAEDLQSEVWIKILDGDGQALRNCRAAASLQTYLVRIAKHALLDGWIRESGKWRPCAVARRAGPSGVLADRLLTREALTPEETLARLQTLSPGTDYRPLVSQLAARSRPRRRLVNLEIAAYTASSLPTPLDELCARQQEQSAALTRRRCRALLARLPVHHRAALEDRFLRNRSLASVAAAQAVPPAVFYRHFAALLRRLRRDLRACDVA